MRQFLSILAIAALVIIAKVSAEPTDCIGSCSSSHIPYLPHKNCSKFCMCVQGSPLELFCPEGLHFSSSEYVCLNPKDAHCQESVPKIENNSCLGVCPPANEDLHQICLLAHEDSHKYCQCSQGEVIVKECPDGLHFDIDYAMCLKPELD